MNNLLLKTAQTLRRLYWRLVQPETRGVRALMVNKDARVLLVQHRYETGWFLPGGKVRRNENDQDALCRELQEELDIGELSQVSKLGEYLSTYEYKKDTIAVFVVRSFTQQPKQHFEIAAQGFFDPRALPQDTSPGTRRRIAEWLGERTINSQW